RALLASARQQAARAPLNDVRAWAGDLAFLSTYLDEAGPVGLDQASRLAWITMVGRHRPLVALHDSKAGEWTIFVARLPDGREIDRLYVSLASGALLWSRDALPMDALAAYARPEHRDDPLSVSFASPRM